MAYEKMSLTKTRTVMLILDVPCWNIMTGFYGLLWGLVLFPLIPHCGKVACVHDFFDAGVKGMIHLFNNIGSTIGFDGNCSIDICSHVRKNGIFSISSSESFRSSIYNIISSMPSNFRSSSCILNSTVVEAILCLTLPGSNGYNCTKRMNSICSKEVFIPLLL